MTDVGSEVEAKIDLFEEAGDYEVLGNPGLTPLATMLEWWGAPCDAWSPTCKACLAWHNWRNTFLSIKAQLEMQEEIKKEQEK